MRAVVLNGPNNFCTKDVVKPEIESNEILLKMKRADVYKRQGLDIAQALGYCVGAMR